MNKENVFKSIYWLLLGLLLGISLTLVFVANIKDVSETEDYEIRQDIDIIHYTDCHDFNIHTTLWYKGQMQYMNTKNVCAPNRRAHISEWSKIKCEEYEIAERMGKSLKQLDDFKCK
jgi:hypothetical protein